ncbi:MAG: hypothetical protein FWE37_09535 [Spirochaetaceae bacterium]|nr:hypothetical protein [Spirochaetaceae bacterium]
MKLWIGAFLILILSGLAAANIWQSWRYKNLQELARVHERQQIIVYEDSKRLITAINHLTAPQRLLDLIAAHPEWQLRRLTATDVIVIEME